MNNWYHHWRKIKSSCVSALCLLCALVVIAPLAFVLFNLLNGPDSGIAIGDYRVVNDERMIAGVQLKNLKTGALTDVPCKGIFVAIGHAPNTQPFAGVLRMDESGYILPEAGSQVRTNVAGVFVAGDCADHTYRQAITAAGLGCQAAIETERWLAEHGQ